MLSKTKGIVLHSIRYGDSSLISTIYTEHFGRKSFLMQGIYKPKATVKANLFQPLTLLKLETSINTKRDLQRIREVTVASPLHDIYISHTKQSITFFIAEVLYKTIREEEPNPGLFEFLFHSVLYLDAKETEVSNFHLVFLAHLSKYLGFFPLNNHSEQTPIFDSLNGKFVSTLEPGLHLHSPRLSEKIHHLLSLNFENAHYLTLNRFERKEILETLMEYYSLHLHGKVNIQSLQVLKEVFDME